MRTPRLAKTYARAKLEWATPSNVAPPEYLVSSKMIARAIARSIMGLVFIPGHYSRGIQHLSKRHLASGARFARNN